MSKKIKEQISNELEEKKFYTKPLFIIIVVLVVVVVGISLAYAINQNMVNKEKEAKIAELQKKVNNLTDYIESLQVGNVQNTNQAAAENQVQSFVGSWPEYTNDTFGFSLTLPEAWEGYLLTETANFIDFGFEAQNPVARISVIGHEQWDQVRTQENNRLVYVGETDQFVIVYSLVGQVANEEIRTLVLEFSQIMETLTLAEGELIVKDYSMEEVVAEDFTYTNEKYGFTLDFPGSWSKYEVQERSLNFGASGSVNSLDFYLEKDKSVFNIGFIEKDKWEIVKDLSYYQATKLGENNEYVFGYVVPSKANADLVESLQSEIDGIRGSFQLIVSAEDDDSGDGTEDEIGGDASIEEVPPEEILE